MLGPAERHRPDFSRPVLVTFANQGLGRLTRLARVARCWLEVPKPVESALSRLRYRWAGCSQGNPMPPCIWTHSSAAWTATSPHWALARATATGVSSSPSARQAGAARAGARGLVDAPPQVGQPVLEPLERADRAGELAPLLDVGDGHLQALLGHAQLLGGQPGRARDQAEAERVRRRCAGRDRPGLGV